MTYIQRLFDGAAALSGPPVAPTSHAPSPVLAADQRLGIFPGLVDPMAPMGMDPDVPVAPRTPDAPVKTTVRETRERVIDRRTEVTTAPPTPHRETAQAAPAPTPSAAPVAPAPAMNTLQRLVESDPLPAPAPPAVVEAAPRVPEPPAAAPPAPQPVPPAPPVPKATPVAAPIAPPISPLPPDIPVLNPTQITPDQFTPADSTPTPLPPAAPIAAPVTDIPPPAPAAPLQPIGSDGPSPVARQADIPLPPPPTAAQLAPAPAPEKIIERIREVPVASAPPAIPQTAAAQSVIGSLTERRGTWRPRQGGF